MMDKAILYSYFQKTADVLLAEFERSKEQNASANLGRNREMFCKEFLSKVLPPKLSIHSGEIWDASNNKAGQLDVVILRDDCPRLDIGLENIYLVEGVFAVIEVKSNLTRKKLTEAADQLSKVASLKKQPDSVAMVAGPSLNRPLRIIFAYKGATWETIVDEIYKRKCNEIFDLISILSRGVLVKKGGLLRWDSNDEFYPANSKAAALGLLYFYLVSYGTSFLARSLNLHPYFEPLNNWDDSL